MYNSSLKPLFHKVPQRRHKIHKEKFRKDIKAVKLCEIFGGKALKPFYRRVRKEGAKGRRENAE